MKMSEYSRPENSKDLHKNFEQIKPLMNETMAYYESSRCLYCYDAPCVQACPTGIDIPLFIRQINTGNVLGAAKTIFDSNYLANACGKACPTEVLCEGACVYNHQDVKPIEIGRLQSYASSKAISEDKFFYKPGEKKNKKVAVIGAGPAGISAACELSLLGYDVHIFEAKSIPSGLTVHGVAPYKITHAEIMEEMSYLERQFGYKVSYNTRIDTKEDITKLESEFDAIFLGIGLGNTRGIGIPGEDLINCVGATEFIERLKIDPFNTFVGKNVVVIGGGNTAMDAASESARMGAENVVVAYRRSKEAKGAYEFEYDLAKSVGVKGLFKVTPVAVLGDERVSGIKFIMTDSQDGFLVPVTGSEFKMECDMVINATGQAKMTGFLSMIDGLNLNENGTIKIDEESYQTTNPKYFASGDAVNGGKELVNAVAEAKIAAHGIDRFLNN